VLVDYAHKPDALEAVLKTLRGLGHGRLICVIRMRRRSRSRKAPIMGAIAGGLAHLPILTSTIHAARDPLKIIAGVEQGLIDAASCASTPIAASAGKGYIVEPESPRCDCDRASGRAKRRYRVDRGQGSRGLPTGREPRLKFDDRAVVREIASEMSPT